MTRGRVLAGAALASSTVLAAVSLLARGQAATPPTAPDLCPQVRAAASTRYSEAEAAERRRAANVPTGSTFQNRFADPHGDEQAVRLAVARYALVVEQNPACFDAATKADAAALARTWSVD